MTALLSDAELLRIGYFWPTSRTVVPTAMVAERNPDALDLSQQVRLARELEEAGFDFGLLSDAYGVVSEHSSRIGHHDPSIHALLWAVPLLRATARLGIVSTMHTTFMSIPDLVQLGAQLDHIASGRWGWNITTGYRPEEPLLFGADGLADHDVRYDIAQDCLVAAREFWADMAGTHHVAGRYRSASGHLGGPAPVQTPGPVVVNAGASERGERFAAELCDYLFTLGTEPADVQAVSERVRQMAVEAGRRDSGPRIIASTYCLVRDDQHEAEDAWWEVEASMSSSAAVRVMSSMAGRNASQRIGRALVGTPQSVADQIVERYHDFGYRGLMLMIPYWQQGEMPRYRHMFDRLHEAGVWAPRHERSSLW